MAGNGLKAMRIDSRVEFESWLARDLEVRDELAVLMDDELGLDLTSLDILEAFLLERYPTPDDALTLEQRLVLDAAARHVGLVMVLGIAGAEWDIDLSDTDNVYYALPVVRIPKGPTPCPLALVTACLDRRTDTYLRSVVQHLAHAWNAAESG